nr:testis-expressed protein 47-like isoform X1 [Megalopta genalis]XP_033338979.1 testis-expressed protein 47-like isoform X1 [Megalopta genalis]
MDSVIKYLKDDVRDVLISGMFLVYPKHYIHLLEAPEDIIYKHLKAFYEKYTEDCNLGRSVFLPFYHHIHQRFFTDWFYIYTTPPTLLESLGSHELSEIKTHVTNCLTKIYVLSYKISNKMRDQSISMADVARNVCNKDARDLPENTVVEYLINTISPVLLSVEEYLKTYSSVPFINLYQDSIWPPPHDFMFSGASARHDRPSIEVTSSKQHILPDPHH